MKNSYEYKENPLDSESLVRVNATLGSGVTNELIIADDAMLDDGMGVLQFSKTDLADGGNISISRLIPADDMVITFDPINDDCLNNLLILFSGTASLFCAENDRHLITPAQGCGFRYSGSPTGFELEKWVEVRSLSVSLPPHRLEGYLDENVPPFFRQLMEATRNEARVISFPVSNKMRAAMEHNIAPGLTGALRQLQLESAALMLITMVAQAMSDTEAPPRPLSNREHRAAQEAYERLTMSLRIPPSLAELSRSVNLTDKRLNVAFRELFGGTVFEVLRNLRLEQARTLIERGEMTIKEVAWQVGYTHVSNFTSAFTTVFGTSPASYARGLSQRPKDGETFRPLSIKDSAYE
ncbi:AraC family transcriptional regulator [Azospirillum sp. TSO22-1]|uniref:helix-turn-helix domain-containing protein n=1 Tax=Azospirillum sp. TSO22-1 TaxID=716789 RepID=UPI000D64EE42|nr:AraC family transcriptional regulator [Azospirillum sp. TSO22-1]